MVARVYPEITIAGERIAADYRDSGLTALDNFTIQWGREQVYDVTSSAQLEMELIDPTGEYAGNNSAYAQEVIITVQPYGFVQFRGRVSEVRARPATIAGKRSWRVKITAQDVLTDLARFRLNGSHWPETGWQPGAVYYGTSNYWPATSTPWMVLNTGVDGSGAGSVEAQVTSKGYVTRIGPARNTPANGASQYIINGGAATDFGTALEVIERLYRLVRGGHVNWNPDTRAILQGYAASGGLLSLAYSGGKIVIQPRAGDAAYPPFTIDAGKVIVIDPEARQTVAENISSLEIVAGELVYTTVTNPNATAPAGSTDVAKIQVVKAKNPYIYAIPGAAPGSNSRLRLDLEVSSLTTGNAAWATDAINDEWGGWIAAINGKMRHPGVRFDLARWDYGEDMERALLTLMSDRRPVYFSGSEYARLGAMARQHQIIGGKVGYRDGYYMEATLAAAATTATESKLTIGQLVTNKTPTLGQYDPSVTLADWGTISIGLT
ncbi:hypothetical protein [Leifsonia sp. WHRI 6310E]|uniref:hypothetical protein n=1 Tax=Leifsonia sp. WHRI 6310E TaxID=3162562 RepID=UPI0032EAC213